MQVANSFHVRVLVVDDLADNRNLLVRFFTNRGFQIAQAESGPAALALIKNQRFDAILLDILMPVMDGIEVLKRIRAVHSKSDLPVIMVSGKTAKMDISLALDLGANDYITKPIDNSENETASNYGADVKLGLPLAHRYCRLMGGELSVQSKFGLGSRFTIQLPVQLMADGTRSSPGTELLTQAA